MRRTCLCILDFDETLFPSTAFLQQFPDDQFPFQVCPETGHVLNVLAEHKLDAAWESHLVALMVELAVLLSQCRHFATEVVLVTNSSKGWIDGVVTHFMPALRDFFADLPQIHCREKYGALGTAYVKHHAVLDLVRKYEPDLIFAIGDQYDDYLSARHSIDDLEIALRFLKLPATPQSLYNFILNLRRACQIMCVIMISGEPLDYETEIYVELKMKESSPSL